MISLLIFETKQTQTMTNLKYNLKAVLRIRGHMDPHHFENPDSDPQKSEKLNPDTHQSHNSGAVEVHNGGVGAENGAVEGLLYSVAQWS